MNYIKNYTTPKKWIGVAVVGLLATACSAPLTMDDITDELVAFTSEKRQIVLETEPSDKMVVWQNGNANGRMMVTSTNQKQDGTYCRMLWEETFVDKRKLQLHNEWCRNNVGQWNLRITVPTES